MNLIFSDEHIAVIEKSAGELCESGYNHTKGIPDALQKALGREAFPVHRLDRESAGVMVYALTKNAAADISRQITDGVFQKEYLAVVQGAPASDEGDLFDLLFFDRAKNKSFPVRRIRRGVKEARLNYRVVEKAGDVTLVAVHLLTGRTHQIRVQFASRRTPLYGDRKYGGSGDGVALFCRKISFLHPITKAAVSFSALPNPTGVWGKFNSLIK